MSERVSKEPTPYMVHCREHGEVYLTANEYMRQMMRADSLWACPICMSVAYWDDENYEKMTEAERGEGQCHDN